MFNRTTWALISSSTLAINIDNHHSLEDKHTLAQLITDYHTGTNSVAMTGSNPLADFYSHGSDVMEAETYSSIASLPRSTDGSIPLRLKFKNYTDERVELIWYDYNGVESRGTFIDPN